MIINRDRFDAWAELALIKSALALDQYLEQVYLQEHYKLKINIRLTSSKKGFNINKMEQLETFNKTVYLPINLFRKAVEHYAYEQTIWMEYGSFLYQIHSYCSRQLKLVNI